MQFDPDNPLSAELRQEMATAYFSACRKMVAALDALKEFDRAACAAPENEHFAKQRAELLETAGERVYFVIIQREAMKLPWQDVFFDDYGISDEVRARIGPKPPQTTPRRPIIGPL